MKFPYAKVLDFPKHQKRTRLLPWVRVGVYNSKNKANIVYPLGLVDSGADLTIMDREIGESLGYEIERGSKVEIKGVGGGSVAGFIHKIRYRIENIDNAKNVFPKSYPQQTAVIVIETILS